MFKSKQMELPSKQRAPLAGAGVPLVALMVLCALHSIASPPCLASGGPGSVSWERVEPAEAEGASSQGRGVALDPQGNILVTGYVLGADGNHDMVVFKYAPDGEPVWSRRYDYSWYDVGTAVSSDAAGNVIVAGASQNFDRPADIYLKSYYTDYALLKYSPDGELLFEVEASGNGKNNVPSAICVDPDGSIYVTGMTRDAADTHNAYYTVKFLPDGEIAWERIEDWGADAFAAGIVLAPDYVIVTGHVWDGVESNFDIMTARYSRADGAVASLAVYKAPGFRYDETAGGMAIAPGGGVVITGRTSDGEGLALTLRLDAELKPLWAEPMFVYARETAGVSVAADERGRPVVAGWMRGRGAERSAFIIAYGADGSLGDLRDVMPGSGFVIEEMVMEPDGDLVAAGTTFVEGEPDRMTVVRLTGYPAEGPSAYDLEGAFVRRETLSLASPPAPMPRKVLLTTRTVLLYGSTPAKLFVAEPVGMTGDYEYRFFVTRGDSLEWELVRDYSPVGFWLLPPGEGGARVSGVMVQVRETGSKMEYQGMEYMYLEN